jgi:hypothetical protein
MQILDTYQGFVEANAIVELQFFSFGSFFPSRVQNVPETL